MRTAVIGVGYLGRFHAQKYRAAGNSELIGVADPSAVAREAVAAELGVAAFADHRQMLGRVDAVSVVTPTPIALSDSQGVPRERRSRAGRKAHDRDPRRRRRASSR